MHVIRVARVMALHKLFYFIPTRTPYSDSVTALLIRENLRLSLRLLNFSRQILFINHLPFSLSVQRGEIIQRIDVRWDVANLVILEFHEPGFLEGEMVR